VRLIFHTENPTSRFARVWTSPNERDGWLGGNAKDNELSPCCSQKALRFNSLTDRARELNQHERRRDSRGWDESLDARRADPDSM
jgi:hypothetical protein